MDGITRMAFITVFTVIGIVAAIGLPTISSALAQTSMSNSTGGNATGGNATGGNANDTSGRTSDLGRF
jgi:hypothetical protein